ncbi:hypothetical protein ACQ4PT_036522 [Festuca glaucescens]
MRIERCLSRSAQISSSLSGSCGPQSNQQLLSELQPAIEAIKRLLLQPQSGIEADPFLFRELIVYPKLEQPWIIYPEFTDNEVDRLSKLPDDVLLNIVERLDITDVARTAILSRRWKQIPTMLSKIILTVCSFEPKHGRRNLTSHDIVRANTTMLKATRSILESRTGSLYTIHLMSMQFYLGDDSIFIGQTVANTIATQKVASVEFTILTKLGKNCTSGDLLTYGKQFMTFFDSCPNAFGGLAHLWLENLRLGESYFPKKFGICKQLQFLHLWQCDTGHLSLLEVQHPQLRELVISCSSLQRVDLKWVPKLTVVKFNVFISPDDPFSLGYVPLLPTVSIINTGLSEHKMLKLSELLRKTAISNLHLNFKSEKIWVKPEARSNCYRCSTN